MRRHSALALFSIIGGLLLALSGPGIGSPSVAFGSTPQEAGYFDFAHPGVGLPTSDKPQSKLWFNDGRWWASLFNKDTGTYQIYWLNLSTQSWEKTVPATDLDTRAQTQSDILWDNTAKKLYIVSGGTGLDAWFMRYSYNSATKTYARDFNPVVVRSGGGETIVLDKDSTGKLWVTYTQGNQVYVNRSTTSDTTWGARFAIPGAAALQVDDISSIIAYKDQNGSSIGVLWSNHNAPSSMLFSYHKDGDPDSTWRPIETIYTATCAADDHINLKSIQADASGTIFAVVKTSFGDSGCNGGSNPVMINLVVRKANNTWSKFPFGYKNDDHTRPVLLLDTTNRKVYIFATSPTSCGAIYMKSTSMDNPNFATQPGKGTPFIKSSTYDCINNATTTKQTVDASTGLVVLASDESKLAYLHNYLDLGSQTFPRLIVQTNPSGGQANTPFASQPVIVAQSAPNVTMSYTGPVTLSIKAGTGAAGAVLGGTVMVHAVGGVANFSGLSLNKAGTGYRLTATSPGLSSVDSAVFDVSKTEQTITFGALASKQYGDPPFTVSATASSGLNVSFSASGNCTITSRTVTITAAGSCTVTANQAGDTTFTAAPAQPQPFTILKANQTITFDALPNKRFGDPPFVLSASASSGLLVAFSVSGACTLSGSTVTLTGTGGCSIKASQAGNANYNAAADVLQATNSKRKVFLPLAIR